MRAVIFANGELSDYGSVAGLLEPDDLIIAADGGCRHCLVLGLTPHLVIGDLDSISPHEMKTLAAANVTVIRHPTRKDQTDLELALALAVEKSADEVLLLGALGRRWDMTLANIMLLAAGSTRADIRLRDGPYEFVLLQGQDRKVFQGRRGDGLSLLPLSQTAEGVTLRGLEYPLDNDTLPLGSTWGISNVFLEDSCEVSLKEGLLLCVITRRPKD
ncbi:MAG: thiamine diphosphokinase [Thermodesulfobacteriota bacterium]